MLGDVTRVGLDVFNKILSPVDSYFSKGGLGAGPPLFIVGAPRSGTTLTYQVITQQMQVGYFTGIMNYLYGIPNFVARTLKPFHHRPAPIFGSVYGKISGALSPAENANFWFQWFPRDGQQGHYVAPVGLRLDSYQELKATVDSISRIAEKHMVFKSVYLSMVVGALAQIFTEARFIFVRRDRFYTCQSLLLGRLKRRNPNEWWSVKIPQYRELLSMPLWYQVVNQVVCTENIVQKDLDRFASERYLILRYEDLCTRPHHVIRGLEEWLRPLGYVSYSDVRVPETFNVSNEKILPADLIEKINDRLHSLEQGTRA
jgi:hypothetical protein